MSVGGARDNIHEALATLGFERAPSRAGGPPRYLGHLTVAEREVAVELSIPCLDFTVFPKVRLLERTRDIPGVAAHIEEDGSICFAAPGSIILDRYDPAGSVMLALQQATRTLADGIAGRSAPDVPAEFTRYWGGSPFLTSLGLDVADGPAEVVTMTHSGRLVSVLTRGSSGLEHFPGLSRRIQGRPAYLLGIPGALDLPRGRPPPDTMSQLIVWAAGNGGRLAERLVDVFRHRVFRRTPPVVFLAAPNGMVGIELESPAALARAAQRPGWLVEQLFRRSGEIRVKRWYGERIDAAFLVGRNLAGKASLAGRRVVLVGCGSIGSHLAKFLVQGGAGQQRLGGLWLIDNQLLSPGNIGRHLLGPEHLHRPKAEALAEVLLRSFPNSNIVPRCVSAMDAECKSLLQGADLVVDASGEEALSLAINDMLVQRRPTSPDALYAWLCGNGAAVQALFVSGKDWAGACRKCLHRDLGVPPLYDPVKTGWGAREIPAACGEAAFLPYGVGAPAIGAGLASTICMDWVEGSVPMTLRTLRIDLGVTVEVPGTSPPRIPGCPCCGGRTEVVSCDALP